MKITPAAKLDDFSGQRKWFVVDAEDVILGKLATKVANILRGKEKAQFSPHVDCGDYVVIINAEKIALSGNKLDQKKYRRHSGYLGNMKSQTAKEVLERNPKRVVEEAVYGMLPKNKLRKHFMSKLHIHVGTEHSHAGQNPEPLTIQ